MGNWLNSGEAKRLESEEWQLTIEDLCGLMSNYRSSLPDKQKEYAVRAISFVMSNLERRGLIDDQFMDIRESFTLDANNQTRSDVSAEYKLVELPDYDNVPRWLLLTGEIDLRYFLLEQMFKGWDRRDGLTKMIDQATGYEEKLQADAKELASEINWLRREYDKEKA